MLRIVQVQKYRIKIGSAFICVGDFTTLDRSYYRPKELLQLNKKPANEDTYEYTTCETMVYGRSFCHGISFSYSDW